MIFVAKKSIFLSINSIQKNELCLFIDWEIILSQFKIVYHARLKV